MGERTPSFVDEAEIQVQGGAGGAGCTSFRREAHVPRGGPDGGDGGPGGDVILEADNGVSTLLAFRYQRHYKADRGTHGKGARRDGARGEDTVLKVPVGTTVRDADSGELLGDLVAAGQRAVVARGGSGGRGNTHFVTPTRRAPGFSELGEPAEERRVSLELRLLADAALVGFPNTGKSSMIARMSAARPKVAEYPFTTLVPNLGVVRAGEHSFVIADIPGLIEGASEGAGLGHAFLRHIERTALIVHVVDLSGGYEGRSPVSDLEIVERELASHAPELAARPTVVVGNKLDLPGAREASRSLQAACETREVEYHEVSALTGTGMDGFILALGERVHRLRTDAALPTEQAPAVFGPKSAGGGGLTVEREGGGWVVRGRTIERMVVMTDTNNEEAVAYLQMRLERAGVERALLEAGARTGDEVIIAGRAFEFSLTGESDHEGREGPDE